MATNSTHDRNLANLLFSSFDRCLPLKTGMYDTEQLDLHERSFELSIFKYYLITYAVFFSFNCK